MKDITTLPLEFTPLNRKNVTTLFDEPRVSSEAGVLYLREVDQRIGLTDRLVSAVNDPRRPTHIHHHLHELLRQRVTGRFKTSHWRSLQNQPVCE